MQTALVIAVLLVMAGLDLLTCASADLRSAATNTAEILVLIALVAAFKIIGQN